MIHQELFNMLFCGIGVGSCSCTSWWVMNTNITCHETFSLLARNLLLSLPCMIISTTIISLTIVFTDIVIHMRALWKYVHTIELYEGHLYCNRFSHTAISIFQMIIAVHPRDENIHTCILPISIIPEHFQKSLDWRLIVIRKPLQCQSKTK